MKKKWRGLFFGIVVALLLTTSGSDAEIDDAALRDLDGESAAEAAVDEVAEDLDDDAFDFEEVDDDEEEDEEEAEEGSPEEGDEEFEDEFAEFEEVEEGGEFEGGGQEIDAEFESGEDSEEDLAAELERMGASEASDAMVDEAEQAMQIDADATPALMGMQDPLSGAAAPTPVSAVKNSVKDLRFRMAEKNSQISVRFAQTPSYREVKSGQTNQLVYYFDNTETPARYQRAYDTSQFPSPVGLFTLLQLPGQDPPLSKLIIQLREDKAPKISITKNTLTFEFPPAEVTVVTTTGNESEEDGQAVEENIYASGQTFSGKIIERLEIKDSDVQDVLRLIARTSGYNIVVGEDVKGKVGTLSLENVPWDQAFTLVLQSKKLGYIRQGNVIRVGTLAALKAEKEAALANQVSKLQVESLRTVIIPISYAKANVIAPRAKTFLTKRGSIETDERTNTIIVRDVSSVIDKVQKLFVALDTQPPRVSISAKIVEMLSSFTRQIGFSAISAAESFSGINIDSALAMTVGGVSSTNISASRWANLNANFQIGELEDKVKILANPVVSAVANQKAEIKQSISFFVPTLTVVGGVVTTSLKQITANLNLDVLPIVSSDGGVIMTVKVKNEIPRGSGEERTIDTREVSTQVLVENGDTAVIGGIFNNTVSAGTEGIPFLMRIPIIGFFLSRSFKEDNRNEILVFLTPKILNVEESFKKAL